MIKKLRHSFVRVAMLAAALVLIVLMGLVNVTNYVQRKGSDEELLAVLAENGGRFPGDRGGKSGRPRFMTEETPYETRYFSVTLDESGAPVWQDTAQIAAVSPADAETLAQSLAAAGRTAGASGNFRFTAVTYDGGYTQYIFLDCTRNRDAVRTFLLDSVVVTAAGLLVLWGLSWLLSDRAVRPIAESYEKQKSFITNAGHELKTPLAVIESSTDVIELEAGESRWTRSVHDQVARLSALTQQLIALARLDENGGAQLVLEELDGSEAVEEALDPFMLMAEAEDRDLTAELEPGLRARADREALGKIVAILADNALKYASPGGAIRFTLGREGGGIRLRAENPAEELAPGKQEKLFDRFYRGDASRSSEKPGYGLGLPLARSLAEGMGGSLTAHSPDGNQLIFTLRLV